MARLSDIASEIKTLIAGITIANGYAYNFGSINEPDPAKQDFPSADITYASEGAASGAAGQFGWCKAAFKIRVRSKLSSVDATPLHDYDIELDSVMADIKTALGIQNHTLALAYYPVVNYKGFNKEPGKSGDLFTPGSVVMDFEVLYQWKEQG